MNHPFRHSEELDKIAPAFVEAQAELESVPRTAENPFFNSKYAPLEHIVEHLRPILAKHGLAILQTFEPSDNGHVPLSTTLLHSSGQWMGGVLSVPIKKGGDPQAVGSAITYGRRYSLSALLGVVADDDDDGNAATPPRSNATADTRTQQRNQAPSETPSSPAPEGNEGIWEGKLIEVKETTGNTNGREWLKWTAVCAGSPGFSTFSETLGAAAAELLDHDVAIQWERKGKFYNFVGIEAAPEGFHGED